MSKLITGIGGALTLYGMARLMDANFILPFCGVTTFLFVMASFARRVGKDIDEAKTIKADEIIPPTRKRLESRSNEVYDIPVRGYIGDDDDNDDEHDMQSEIQYHRMQAKEAKQAKRLSETRHALKSMKYKR